MKLKFKEKINSMDLSNDLLYFEINLSHQTIRKNSSIEQSLSKYLEHQESRFNLSKLLNPEKTPYNLAILKNADELFANQFFTDLPSTINGNFLKFSAINDDLSKLGAKVSKEFEVATDLFNRERQQTYIYIEGLDDLISKSDKTSPEFLKLQEILNDCSGKSHITVITKDTNNVLNDFKNSKMVELGFKTNAFKEKIFNELLEQTAKKMDECDFSYIDKKGFIDNYINSLIAERAGLATSKSIGNGILLKGDNLKTKIIANSIKKSLDINYTEVEFTFPNVFESIQRIVKVAEDAKVEYQKTGKRTILEINNLDKFLTNESDENLRMIARFKSFAELVSEKYHTTLLMRTNLPYNNFECASIGTNRFPIKIKIKE